MSLISKLTAMGGIVLDLQPGLGICLFSLAFAQIGQQPNVYDIVHVKYLDEVVLLGLKSVRFINQIWPLSSVFFNLLIITCLFLLNIIICYETVFLCFLILKAALQPLIQ